jgi:hypothetical protein
MEHDAELSLQDLAYLMMAVSDNAATDVIVARVGLPRINATLRSLGLERTVVAGDCANIVQAITGAVGVSSLEELLSLENPEVRRRLLACRTLDALVAARTTPRELTALLATIWRGGPGYPPPTTECAGGMASSSATPASPGRFRTRRGWGPRAALLPDVVNEAGVVDDLDGRRFAVAVFTRQPVDQPPPASQPRARSAARSGRSPASPSSTSPPLVSTPAVDRDVRGCQAAAVGSGRCGRGFDVASPDRPAPAKCTLSRPRHEPCHYPGPASMASTASSTRQPRPVGIKAEVFIRASSVRYAQVHDRAAEARS